MVGDFVSSRVDPTSGGGGITYTRSEDSNYFGVSYNTTGAITTLNKLNITKYSSLVLDLLHTKTGGYNVPVHFGISDNNGNTNLTKENSKTINSTSDNLQTISINVDIKSNTGSYYVKIKSNVTDGFLASHINNVYLI